MKIEGPNIYLILDLNE